jgi:two-component system, NtrC family, response regulator GlrR
MHDEPIDMENAGPSAAAGSRRRVVLVDDDPDFVRIVTTLLTQSGYEVVAFNQFEAARDHLMTSTPDVIMSDVRLGAFNGLQLVLLVKLNHPETTAVVLTGFDDPVLRAEAQRAGAHYLVKPVHFSELLAKLN